MSRRSRSLSQIPLRHLTATTSGGENVKTRSSSITRMSYRDSLNTLKVKTNPSHDRRSQTGVKQTPINKGRNFQRSTPGSLRSCGSTNRISPGSVLKERKSIQKLSSNKIWVANQFAKVQHYISTSDLFDPSMVTPKNIKPPTTKVFIYVITVLLKQLFPSVQITMENYKEELISKLKLMHYPGTLTNSLLKTVNTMHSWPQVIGLFGWLVDKVMLTDTGVADLSTIPDEEKPKYLLPRLCSDYILKRYDNFNDSKGECQEREDEIDQTFATKFAEILELDIDKYKQMKSEYDEMEKCKNNLLMEIDETTESIKSAQIRKKEILDKLVNMEETDEEENAEVEVELKHFTSLLNKRTAQEKELRDNITKLEKSIKNQPCTPQERKNLLERIKMIKNEIKIFTEKMKYAQDIKNEFDIKINEEREKLQSKVISWNRSLMAVCIKKPHLKNLLLKETGLHRAEFLDEIREISKIKIEVENDVLRKIESLELTIKQITVDIQSMTKELTEAQQETNRMVLESKQYREESAIIENDTKQKLAAWELQKDELIAAMKDSEEKDQLQALYEEINELKKRRQDLQDELNKFKVTSVNFVIELHKQIVTNILEMNKILEEVNNRVEAAVHKELEETNQFNSFLVKITSASDN